MAETLFSLEVHVESVKGLRVPCSLAALCFRLLDFPTLIVHHISPLEAEKLREKLSMEDKVSSLDGLKDRHGSFQFHKGKSCLFKASIDSLVVQLQTVPLYLMLMDLWPRKPVLVGSTYIPLKNAVDQIYADVLQKGISVPSFYRDSGVFELFNLMGTQIAVVKLGYRLLSLGGTLIPHIPRGAFANRELNELGTVTKVEQAIKGAVEKTLPENEAKIAHETRQRELGDVTEGNLVGSPERQANKQNVEIQTDIQLKNLQGLRPSYRGSYEDKDEILITNTIYPPPLYFNYFSNSRHENGTSRVEKSTGHLNGIDNRAKQELDNVMNASEVDFVYYDPGHLQVDGTVSLTSVSVQTEQNIPKNSLASETSRGHLDLLSDLSNVVASTSEGQLPILNALLQEIIQISGAKTNEEKKEGHEVRKLSTTPIQPKLPGNNITGGRMLGKVHPAGIGMHVDKARKSETRDKQRVISSGKKQQSSVIGLPRKRVHFKKTSLTYGMTRTQQMRFEMNQKDRVPERRRPCECATVVPHEKIEKKSQTRRELSKTYRISTAKKGTSKLPKERSDVEVQTEQMPMEANHDHLDEEALELQPGISAAMENDSKPCYDDGSARSIKSQNSLEVFIPQMEGEVGDRSDHDDEWTTDHKPVSYYGFTGITPDELEVAQRASAMTMYSDDFEESKGGEQGSFHSVSSTGSNFGSEKRKSRDLSSSFSSSTSVSAASEIPTKSTHSPVKTKSAKLRSRLEKNNEVDRKITVQREDNSDHSISKKPQREIRLSSESNDHVKGEESEDSYSDDFHSVDVGSEPDDSHSNQTNEAVEGNVLDLPAPANSLG